MTPVSYIEDILQEVVQPAVTYLRDKARMINMQKGGGAYNKMRSAINSEGIQPEDITQIRIKRIPWDKAPYKWFSDDENEDKK